MKITVRSTEIVRATVTQPAYRTRLSNNDLVMPKCYTTGVLFYKNVDHSKTFMESERLKKSLVQILDRFYELAGRIETLPDGNMEVTCTNEGVEFVVADADFDLVPFEQCNFGQMSLPDEIIDLSMTHGFLFKVKLIYLTDGSVMLAAAMHHSLADGHGYFTFVKAWADSTLINECNTLDAFDGTERKRLFGTNDALQFDHPEYRISNGVQSAERVDKISKCKAHLTSRIFHISKDNLNKLKQKVSSQLAPSNKFISTNDALSALLWQSVTQARTSDGDDTSNDNVIKLGMACNGRKRFSPPMPDSYLGNVNFYICCELNLNSIRTASLSEIALKVRELVDKSTSEWMTDCLNWVEKQPDKTLIRPGFDAYLSEDFSMTSWAGFPIYETDFGWGAPISFRIVVKAFDGLAILLPSRSGGGIDVTLGLYDEHMKKLIANETMAEFCECIG